MSDLRFAVIGTGYWAQYQLAAWGELEGVQCIALCDCVQEKADLLATKFGIARTYADAREMLESEHLDFVDIISDVHSHADLVALAAEYGLHAICQKPLARDLETARDMVARMRDAGCKLFVHENWRWQTPIRTVKRIIESRRLGEIVRGRIDYANSFPVFENQPFLKDLEHFILADMGTHILDVARFLWGEVDQLVSLTRRLHDDIAGEDVASVMMNMHDGVIVTCHLSYASKWEFDCFPEAFVAIEGSRGGLTMSPDYHLRIDDESGTEILQAQPPRYTWAHPDYGLVHSSIVDCHRDFLRDMRGEGRAETTGEDNLRTLELVYAAYVSASSRSVQHLDQGHRG